MRGIVVRVSEIAHAQFFHACLRVLYYCTLCWTGNALCPRLGTRLLDYGCNCDSSDPWKDCGTLLCLLFLSVKYWAVSCVCGVCIAKGQRFEESTSQFLKCSSQCVLCSSLHREGLGSPLLSVVFDINCDLFLVFVHLLEMNCPIQTTWLHISTL